MKKSKKQERPKKPIPSPEHFLLGPFFSCLRYYKKYGKPFPERNIYNISVNEEGYLWVLVCFDIKTVGITKEKKLEVIDDSWLSTDILCIIKIFYPEIIIDLDISKIHRGCICFEDAKAAINDPTNFIDIAKKNGCDFLDYATKPTVSQKKVEETKMEQNKKRNFYTVKEVRELVYNNNLSISTIHKLIKQDVIPYTQLCRKRLIPAWWVEDQIQKGRECPDELNNSLSTEG